MMDVLPLVLLLVMGVVISTTCGKYTASSSPAPVLPDSAVTGDTDNSASSFNDDQAGLISNASPSQLQLVQLQSSSLAVESGANSKNRLSSSLITANNPSHRNHHHNHHHAHYGHKRENRGKEDTDETSYQTDSTGSGQSGNSPHQSDSNGYNSGHTAYTYLRRHMLANTSVTCNDGTVAGYYLRRAYNSRRWIVFLEGGWYCFSAVTCHQRWLKMRSLMTSAHWPEAKTVAGILSPSQEENPFWWNANHVFIPYCSSDIWSGDSPASSAGDLSFLGSRIVSQVITELLPRGLSDAKLLLLAGSSAGAAGVMINLDRIADLLANAGSKADVRGLADSGWILENQNHLSHYKKPCIDAINCAPMDAIKSAFKMWSSRVPSACAKQYPTEPWRCIFGYRLYPTLKAPLFVFQWLYDEAQMHMDGVSLTQSSHQFKYIHTLGQQLRATLENVSAVFAPSCVSHIVLTKPDWRSIAINKISLPDAIRCWETNTFESNSYHNHNPHNHSTTVRLTHSSTATNDTVLNDWPNIYRKQHKKKRRKHMRRRHKTKREQIIADNTSNASNSQRQSQSHSGQRSAHQRHRWLAHRDQCHHWLVDDCNWPQCNSHCPKIHRNYMD